MSDAQRPTDRPTEIEMEIEVPGTPEEVWRAIATGPGISSWYVPHVVDEREGGSAVASFGPGPEMQQPGRVAAWDPPHRVVFDGGEGASGLAFEWTIESRAGGRCVVRLVNTGFGSGGEWDDQYDAMTDGWRMFLLNLRLHLEHFAGRTATASLPMAMWQGPPADAWTTLTSDLGIPPSPSVGDRVAIAATDRPRLAGTVVDTAPHRVSLILTEPAAGTGFITVEGTGEAVAVSIWTYLYGAERESIASNVEQSWGAWLTTRSITP